MDVNKKKGLVNTSRRQSKYPIFGDPWTSAKISNGYEVIMQL